MTDAMTEDAVFELLTLGCRVNQYGTVRYYNSNERLHRVHGPAIVYTDGARAWYQNDQLHRLDGPAVEYSDGRREWYQNGQRHRVDGPAIELSDGSRAWFINGVELTQAEWQQEVANMGNV